MTILSYVCRSVLFFGYILLANAVLLAQAIPMPMEYFSIEKGLPNNSMLSMIQDQLGYLWLGTGNGLARYDGYEFVFHQSVGGDSTSLLGQQITFMLESGDGNLWLGSDWGLHHFDRGRETFTNILIDTARQNSNPDIPWLVHHLFEDSQGHIWTVSGENNQLHRWDPGKNILTTLQIDASDAPFGQVGKPHPYSNQVPIIEDRAGNIWIGTKGEGLLRYDAAKDLFVKVALSEGTWPSDTLYSLLLDENQTIWAGTARGMARFDIASQSLIPFPIGDPGEGKAVFDLRQDQSGRIWLQQTFRLSRIEADGEGSQIYCQLPEIGFTEDRNGARMRFFVWVGEDKDGNIYWVNPLNHHQVFQFDPQIGQVRTYRHEFPEKNSGWGQNDNALFFSGILDHGGGLWLGFNNGLLKKISNHSHFFTYSTPILGGIRRFAEDSSGKVWMTGSELLLFSPESRNLTSLNQLFSEMSLSFSNLVATIDVTSIPIFDQKYDLWLSRITVPSCYKFELQNNPHAFSNLALGKPVKASSIQATPMHLPEFAVDGDPNTRWASTYADRQWLEVDLGKIEFVSDLILRWELASAKSYQIQLSDDGNQWRTVYTTQNGQGEVETIRLNARGRYLRLLATERNSPYGYSIWEMEVRGPIPKVRLYQSNPADETSLPFAEIVEIFKDRAGSLWFGTLRGLARYLPETDQFLRVQPPQSIQESDFLSPMAIRIFEDQRGRIWFLDGFGQYFFLDPQNYQVTSFQPMSSNLVPIGEGFKDRRGFLWFLAGDRQNAGQGIYRYLPENEQLNYFLADKRVTVILEDQQDQIWIGTEQTGLFQLDPVSGALAHYSVKDGLPFPSISFLEEDKQGRLWIGTSRGLACFDPITEKFEVYDQEDGLFGNAMESSFMDSKGRLYVGGPGGFTMIDPSQIRPDSTPPQMVIDELWVGNQLIRPGEKGSLLSRDISLTPSLQLAHHQNTFSLHVTGLHFNHAETNQYQVRLIGLDTNWVDLGMQRRMNYAGLDPGAYTFEVKGSNADGTWSTNPASLEITILPPWWQTGWAYLAYLILLAFAIYAMIQWRTYSLRRQRQLLRTRVAEQTQELRLAKQEAEAANEAKSTFLSTVSHELRTPLTSVIGFAKINKKRLEKRVLPKIDPSDEPMQKTLGQVSQNNEIIISEGERLTSLINELLDLAKIESGKVDWKMEELNPAELIERAVNATSALFAHKSSLKLITDIPENLPMITGDRDRLLQVLINLISNAVKFTDEGQIKIGVSPIINSQLSTLNFFVQDTGSGIPADQLDKVFERFQQVEDNQAGKPKGTGLGLPICKQIVEHHEGKIWGESELGKGSVFFVRLPLRNQP